MSSTLLSGMFLLLPDREICNSFQVCKSWNQASQADPFWKALSTKRGLPEVEGINEGLRTVFLNLYPRTINAEMFKECFGEIRDIPTLSKERYRQFVEQIDPFIHADDAQQKICRTFWLMIFPSHVFRPYEKKLSLILKDSKDDKDMPKISISKDKMEMKIPFTSNNIKKLIEYSYSNRKMFSTFMPEEFAKCNFLSEKTALWLIREEAVFVNRIFANQKKSIEEKGYELPPLPVRATFNVFRIRKTGTCPDKAENYARTGTEVGKYIMSIGDYHPLAGMHILPDAGLATNNFGAIPGQRVEWKPEAEKETGGEEGE